MSRLLSAFLFTIVALLVCWLFFGNGASPASDQPLSDRLLSEQAPRVSDAIRVGHSKPWPKISPEFYGNRPIPSLTERQRAMSASRSIEKNKQHRAEEIYLSMRNQTLDRLNNEFAESVYSESSILLVGVNPLEPVAGSSAPNIELKAENYTSYADPPVSNENLLPSRGFPRSETAQRAGKPLITYEDAGQNSNLKVQLPWGRTPSLSCSGRAGRSWFGEGRIGNRDFAEPFVVCEGRNRFSIAVDWRTSDVCSGAKQFSLPGPITEVVVSRAGAAKTVRHGVRAKDRLSIRTAGGNRMLVTCENADWKVVLAGTTAWRSKPPLSG